MTTEDLVQDGLGRTLFRMTWPMTFGVLALLGTQLVDSAFVARLGIEPLAALGFTLPVMQLIIGTQVGVGIAATARISQSLGAGRWGRARRLGGLATAGGAVIILALCLLLWLLRGPLVSALGAEPDLLPLIERYWIPWLASAWAGAVVYFGYSVSRANGDTRLPGFMMVATSLLNLALDPLFIFVLGWGLPGAALATLAAFSAGILIVFPRVLARGWLAFELRRGEVARELRELAGIALPAMIGQLMPPVSAMLATAVVAGFGSAAVAAWGVGTRLEFFSIVVVLALTMAMPPMVGRFAGAGELHRVRALVRLAIRFVLGWQLAVALLWMAGSGLLAALLTEQARVAAILQDYLLWVPVSYGGLGVCMILVSVSNALGMPLRALLISCARLFVCYLPAIWIGARVLGLDGVFVGALIGNAAAGLLAWALYRQAMSRLQRSAAPAQPMDAGPMPERTAK